MKGGNWKQNLSGIVDMRVMIQYLLDTITPVVQSGRGGFGVHPIDVVVTIVVVDVASTEIVVVTGCAFSVVTVVVKTVTVTVINFLDVATTEVVAVMDAVAVRVVVEVFVMQGT